jgi:hypothetical protein
MPDRKTVHRSHEAFGKIGGSKFCIISTVKGLCSEKDRFLETYARTVPDALAIPISEEELNGLRKYRGEQIDMTTPERIYAHHLSTFGEVRIPHPVYVECVERAKEDVIPIYSLDLDEVAFSEAYVKHISGLEMVSTSIREKALASKEFEKLDPFDFALEWDKAINSSKGHKRLEKSREEHMAGRIIDLLDKHHVLLAVVEHERSHGILERIATMTTAIDKNE